MASSTELTDMSQDFKTWLKLLIIGGIAMVILFVIFLVMFMVVFLSGGAEDEEEIIQAEVSEAFPRRIPTVTIRTPQ